MTVRCGRCGLWNQYPENHPEKKWAGVCIWYQLRLQDADVWEDRECPDFFERMPGFHAMDHFDYKIKRDNLGSAYTVAKRAKTLAYVGLGISLISISLGILKFMGG